MTDDIDAIIRGLSKAQREAVTVGNCIYYSDTCVCLSPELKALNKAGLVILDGNGARLNQTGQAVRARLAAGE